MPCVTHGNAGDGKALYRSVLTAWREAKRSGTAIAVEPHLYMVGLELWRRGLDSQARAVWERYLKATTSLGCAAEYAAVVRYNLGVLHDAKGHPDAALRYYELALECEPSHGDALSNAGVAYARRGDFEAALTLLKMAVRTDPTSTPYQANLNQTLLAARLSEGAKTLNYEGLK